LGEEGVIDGGLPKAAPETLFARSRGVVFPLLWGLLLSLAFFGRWRG
jgi:apolipoprotein N-acyltransferase